MTVNLPDEFFSQVPADVPTMITPEQAFHIGHLSTVVIMLNERANSTWLNYKPAKLEVGIEDELDDAGSNVIGYAVYIKVGNINRTVSHRMSKVLTHDEAVIVMKEVSDFIAAHPL